MGRQRPWCWREGDRLRLEILLSPRAANYEIGGLHNGRLRVRIPAPPVDGKANQSLIDFFAREFGVPKRAVHILSGQHSRSKSLQISAPQRHPVWFQSLLEEEAGTHPE